MTERQKAFQTDIDTSKELTPCEKLQAALLARSLNDLKCKKLKFQALAWFESEKENIRNGFTFVEVCETLNLNRFIIRRAITAGLTDNMIFNTGSGYMNGKFKKP